MKKLTDEDVAKALGWKYEGAGKGNPPVWWKGVPPELAHRGIKPPPFTTSLDSIVAEIEARQLGWGVMFANSNSLYEGQVESLIIGGPRTQGGGITAPLALCHALLAYLKETK